MGQVAALQELWACDWSSQSVRCKTCLSGNASVVCKHGSVGWDGPSHFAAPCNPTWMATLRPEASAVLAVSEDTDRHLFSKETSHSYRGRMWQVLWEVTATIKYSGYHLSCCWSIQREFSSILKYWAINQSSVSFYKSVDYLSIVFSGTLWRDKKNIFTSVRLHFTWLHFIVQSSLHFWRSQTWWMQFQNDRKTHKWFLISYHSCVLATCKRCKLIKGFIFPPELPWRWQLTTTHTHI